MGERACLYIKASLAGAALSGTLASSHCLESGVVKT